MGFIIVLKSQHQVTAAGEINLLIVPRDVALQELTWTQWMWAEWIDQAFLILLYSIRVAWWVTSVLPTTTEPLVQRGMTCTRALGNTTAAYLATINNNCLIKKIMRTGTKSWKMLFSLVTTAKLGWCWQQPILEHYSASWILVHSTVLSQNTQPSYCQVKYAATAKQDDSAAVRGRTHIIPAHLIPYACSFTSCSHCLGNSYTQQKELKAPMINNNVNTIIRVSRAQE